MKKDAEEIYKSIEKYLGYLTSKKMTMKQVQNGIFTLMIEYDQLAPVKKARDTKRICNVILGIDKTVYKCHHDGSISRPLVKRNGKWVCGYCNKD